MRGRRLNPFITAVSGAGGMETMCSSFGGFSGLTTPNGLTSRLNGLTSRRIRDH